MAVMYLVTGSTGEYSDRTDWNVAVYVDKVQAETHVALLDAWLRERNWHMDQGRVAYDYRSHGGECPYDPRFGVDYTGTRYQVEEVEAREQAPAVEVKA